MMLQGHFIDTLLASEYRDNSNIIYSTWWYFRGITAPVFFTISGLIFTYLLLKAKEKGNQNLRIRKGAVRGLMLIGIGYALRLPILRWLSGGSFGTYFMVIDVLQCIGLSLILIVCFYLISQKKTLLFSMLLFCSATLIFIGEPLYKDYAAAGIPLFFANYLTKANGSVFTIIPWFGYMAYGAFIATLFYGYLTRPKFKVALITGFFVTGFALVYAATPLFLGLADLSNWSLLVKVANFNYLFIRLGNVLVIFGLFYAFEAYLKQPTVLKIGQKTLAIYVLHFIVLYGSFTGMGLNRILGKNLNPLEAILGALGFLLFVSFIAIHLKKIKTVLFLNIKRLTRRLKSLIQSSNN